MNIAKVRTSRRSALATFACLVTAGCAERTAAPATTRGYADNIHDAVSEAAVLLPGDYTFEGPPLDGSRIHLVGSGSDVTTIRLNTDYLIDSAVHWKSLRLEGVRVIGGLGAIRHRFPGVNVAENFVVQDCIFEGYRGCAISHNSVDMPYWRISGNIFHAESPVQTIGVALAGLTDGCQVSGNRFLMNAVHLKLDRGGNNAYIRENDFIQFSERTSEPRVSLWVVPTSERSNAGEGLVVDSCKFGNENLLPTDYRILYADEGAGPHFGARFPSPAESKGRITGHAIVDCLFNGRDPYSAPPIVSRTSSLASCRIGPVTLAGTRPPYVLQIEKADPARVSAVSIGPVTLTSAGPQQAMSNATVEEVER